MACLAVAITAAIGPRLSLSAATLTWDGDTATAGLQDGGGTWNTTATDRWHKGSSYQAWSNAPADSAVFGNGGLGTATVTLGEAISASSLTFNVGASYTIAGNTLTLSGPSVTVDQDATISSNLAGSAGLTKLGGALLELTGTNAYSGGTQVNSGTLLLSSQQQSTGQVNIFGGRIELGIDNAINSTLEVDVCNGAVLDLAGHNQSISRLDINVGRVELGSGELTLGLNDNSSDLRDWGSPTVLIAGAGSLRKIGTNTAFIGSTTTYTGGTFIDQGAIGCYVRSNVLPMTGDVTIASDAALDLAASNSLVSITEQTVGRLMGSGSVRNNRAGHVATLVVGNGDVSSQFDGVIGGSETLHLKKVGTGTFTLTGTNTYHGDTLVEEGVLQIGGGNNRLPTDTTVVLGTATTAGTFDLNGQDQEIPAIESVGPGPNRVVNSSATESALTVNVASGSTTYDGTLGGPGQNNFWLNKVGPGTLELAGSSTHSGSTRVSSGVLLLSSQQQSTGVFEVFGGRLQLGTDDAIDPANNITVRNAAVLDLNGHNQAISRLNLNVGSVELGSGQLTLGVGNNACDIRDWTAPNVLISGSGSVRKIGTSTAHIGGSTTYTGGTFVEEGTLGLYLWNDVLPTTGDVTINSGARLLLASSSTQFDDMSYTIGGLFGSGQVSVGQPVDSTALTIGNGGASSTFSGRIDDGGSILSLSKTGSGTIALDGTLLYTGSTTVDKGTLAIAGSATLNNSPAVHVGAGATLDVSALADGLLRTGAQSLTGGGTIVGGVLLQSGAIHAPGASTGMQTIDGAYSLDSGAMLEIELDGIDPGSGYDQLTVGGQVTLAGTLELALGFDPGLNQFTLIDNLGSDTVVGTFAGLPEGARLTADFGGTSYGFLISYEGNDGNDVVLSGVPEPNSCLLALLAMACAAVMRRRTA